MPTTQQTQHTPTVSVLVQRWEAARGRTFLAQCGRGPEHLEDYWAELRLGAQIAREATSGRWCAVAELLRAEAVDSWTQLGHALNLTEAEARDGFHDWVTGQRDLHRMTGRFGLTEAEAEGLLALAEGVAL